VISICTICGCRINFKQYEQPKKELPANSEVLKLLLEQEGQNMSRGVAGLAEFQEDRQSKFPKKHQFLVEVERAKRAPRLPLYFEWCLLYERLYTIGS
jgi:hypothetical protein